MGTCFDRGSVALFLEPRPFECLGGLALEPKLLQLLVPQHEQAQQKAWGYAQAPPLGDRVGRHGQSGKGNVKLKRLRSQRLLEAG